MAETTHYKKPMSVVRYDNNGQKYLEMIPIEVTPDKNIIDYSPAQDMRPTDDRQKWEQGQIQQAMNKRSDVAKAIYNVADIPMSFAVPLYGTISGAVHTGLAAKDVKDNGLNWSNGVALGMGLAPLGFHVGPKVYGVAKKYYVPSENNLIGYGNYPGRISNLGPNLHLYPDFSKMTRAEKIQYLRTQKELAQRVDQARNLDALHMTKDRLRKGGFDRIQGAVVDDFKGINSESTGIHIFNPSVNIPIIHKFIKNKRSVILNKKPTKGTALEVQMKEGWKDLNKEHAGTGVLARFYSWFKDAPKSLQGFQKANKGTAHEFVHYTYMPISYPKGFNSEATHLHSYFAGNVRTPNSGEIVARGTQLKNYFGLREGEQLTPEMWNYARRHYRTDVGDNNMTEFFISGNNKYPNHPFFLQWLNKHAPVVTAGVTTISMGNNLLNNE